MGLLGHSDPSSQRGKTPFLPPKKRAEFKSPELHSQHGNGSDENSSKWAAEKPLDPEEVKSNPTPASSSTKTGLGSHVTTAVSAPPPFESSDVDVRMMQRNDDQGDVFGLDRYIEKKRLLSKTYLVDVEEEVKVSSKKTRLGFGQGLAKYEKQKKELQKLVSDGENGGTGNEAIVYTTTAPAPASSEQPSPPPGKPI